MFSISTAAMLPLLLLLLLRDTLAVAPGDEYDGCEVPDYPVNITVLMDSWRYQTLLAGNDATNTITTAVWTTENTDRGDTVSHNCDMCSHVVLCFFCLLIQWYSTGGVCENSTVEVCSGEPGEKWLKTQYINKSLPAPDEYPVRVFVNITYSSLACPRMMCDPDFELHIAHSNMNDYSKDGIMPTHRIAYSPDTAASVKEHFYFDLSEAADGFYLGLKSRPKGVCVNVSRVLVYHYECPQLSVGLTRLPATQAPVSGAVFAIPGCAENSNHSNISKPEGLLCTFKGNWLNYDQIHCVCDIGYSRDRDKCEGILQFIIMCLAEYV